MIQDKIFFDEKDPTGLSYNTPFTYYGSYQGRLWSKSPSGSIQYYTQNSDLSAYATTGSNQFSGSQTVTGSLTVTGTITGTVAGTTATASYVEYTNVANKPALVSGSAQVTYSGLTGIPSGIVSGSAQIASFGIFATTGSNGFNGSQSITGSLTVTGQVVAQTLNVQQVTSSVVYSSGSNVFGNELSNTQQFTGSLSVNGQGTFYQPLTNSTAYLTIQNNRARNAAVYTQTTNGGFYAGTSIGTDTFNYQIYDGVAGSARLTISSTGAATFSSRVGVGGAAATYSLTAYNASNGTTAAFGGTARGIRIDNDGTFSSGRSTIFGVDNTFYGSYQPLAIGGSELYFSISGTDRLTISSTGAATFSSSVTATGAKSQFTANGGDSAGAGISLNTTLTTNPTLRRNWGIFTEDQVEGDFTIKCSTAAGGSAQIGNTRLAILSNGNVGIGVISPGYKLDVNGDIRTNAILYTNDNGPSIYQNRINAGWNTIGDNIDLWINYEGYQNGLDYFRDFRVGNGKRGSAILFIDGSNGSSTFSGSLTVGKGITVSSDAFGNYFGKFGAASTALLELREFTGDQTGTTLILRSSRTSSGNLYAHIQAFADSSTQVFRVLANGAVENATGAYGSISDIKLKENIVDATPKLEDLLKVKIRNYNLIGEENKQIGVIAQELEEIFPGLVSESEDFQEVEITDEEGNTRKEKQSLGTTTKSVKYSIFVPMLIKAIQELSAKVETLEAEIQTLKQ